MKEEGRIRSGWKAGYHSRKKNLLKRKKKNTSVRNVVKHRVRHNLYGLHIRHEMGELPIYFFKLLF